MKTIDNKKEGRIIQIYPRQTEIRQSITQGSTVNSNPAIEEQGKNTVAESFINSNSAIGVQGKNTVAESFINSNSAIGVQEKNTVAESFASSNLAIEVQEKNTVAESSASSNSAIGVQEKNTVSERFINSNSAIEVQEKSIQVVKIKPNTYDTLRQAAKTKNNEASEQARSQKQEMQSLTENAEDLNQPLRFSNSEACTGGHPTESPDINGNSFFNNNDLGERHKNTDLSTNPTMETNAAEETFKNIKHKEKSATFYVKLFALFFFFGVCLCVSGKWKADGMGKKLISIFDKDLNSFSSFCVNLAPIVFSSFVVFASGFTLYAPFVTWIYSACMFFVVGVLSGYMVTSLGINLVIITTLILIGIFSVLNVTLCAVSVGMSKIATNGIKGISISDGILYFVIYVFYMAATWGIVSGIKGLIS